MDDSTNITTEPRWTREDVQRVLYHIITCYEQAQEVNYHERIDGELIAKQTKRRYGIVGKRRPFLGGDSEFLRAAIRMGVTTLKENNWWPDD